jgi:hypothetical protein
MIRNPVRTNLGGRYQDNFAIIIAGVDLVIVGYARLEFGPEFAEARCGTIVA